jgi:hypothetical protein
MVDHNGYIDRREYVECHPTDEHFLALIGMPNVSGVVQLLKDFCISSKICRKGEYGAMILRRSMTYVLLNSLVLCRKLPQITHSSVGILHCHVVEEYQTSLISTLLTVPIGLFRDALYVETAAVRDGASAQDFICEMRYRPKSSSYKSNPQLTLLSVQGHADGLGKS